MPVMGAIMQPGPHITCPLFLFDSNQNGKASTNVSTDGSGLGVGGGRSGVLELSCTHTDFKRSSA
jgi:hypothetical protein